MSGSDIDFDKLEAKIASITRLTSKTNELQGNTSDLNSSIYTSEYSTDDSSDDDGNNDSSSNSQNKKMPIKRRESELTNEGFLSALEQLDATSKMTKYIPKSMRQFFSTRHISHQMSMRLLKTENISMFINLLEQDEEVKRLNRTATPKSINLSFASNDTSSMPGTPTLGFIDDFILELEQEGDLKPSTPENSWEVENIDVDGGKMDEAELGAPRSSNRNKKNTIRNKTPSSKLIIQSTSPVKSNSPKRMNNSSLKSKQTTSPVKATRIKSLEQMTSPKPRKSPENRQMLNSINRKIELEKEAAVAKHILSHVDKMILEEDKKMQIAKGKDEISIVDDHKVVTKQMARPQTPTRSSTKVVALSRSSSRRKKKKNTTPTRKTPIQHTLKLTPKRKNDMLEQQEKMIQSRPSPPSRPPIQVTTPTTTIEINPTTFNENSGSSSPVQTNSKNIIKSKRIRISSLQQQQQQKQKQTVNTRPVNSQDELNTLLRDAVESKRSLFGIKLKSLQDIFLAIDKDNSGTIDLNEFQNGIKRLGITLTKKAIQELMNVMDPSNNGFISYDQWVEQTTKIFKRSKVKRSQSTASHKVLSKKQILKKQKMDKLKALESAMLLAEVAELELEKPGVSIQSIKKKKKRKRFKNKSRKNPINTNFYQRAMLWKQELKDRNDKEKYLKMKMEEEEWETLKTCDVSKKHSKAFDGSKFYENNVQWQQRKDLKSKEMKNANLLNELAECDFELNAVKKKNANRKPLVVLKNTSDNDSSNSMNKNNSVDSVGKMNGTSYKTSSGNANKNTSVYDRRIRWKQRKMAKLEELMQAKEESLINECTFKPKLNNDEYRTTLAANARKRRKAREERIAKMKQKEAKLQQKKLEKKLQLAKKAQARKPTLTTSLSILNKDNGNKTTVDDANYLLHLSSKFVSQSRKDRTAMDTTVRKAKRTLKKRKKRRKKQELTTAGGVGLVEDKNKKKVSNNNKV
eukprot:g9701.t1